MKSTAILAFLLLLSTISLGAQSPVAKFIFEDAEAAFANQQYDRALQKLREAEEAFGNINPPILYLRIMVRNDMVKNASLVDGETLEHLLEDCRFYLNEYGGIPAIVDQAREVYRISDGLRNFPVERMDALLAAGNFEAAIDFADHFGRTVKTSLPEPAHRLKVLALHRLVTAENYDNAERARRLVKEVGDYRARFSDTAPDGSGDHLREIQDIEANLAGLEDYLEGKRLLIARDFDQSLALSREAARQGSPMGMAAVGVHFLGGHGTAQDVSMAKYWFEKAGDFGHAPVAYLYLGRMYHNGWGVTQNHATAHEWYEKAIVHPSRAHSQVEAEAMLGLGVLYRDGQGVTQDLVKTVEWFRKAAEAGNPTGLSAYGSLYFFGRGVSQNDAIAKKWWELAAVHNETIALFNLGYLHETGRGVPQNYAVAVQWYTRAADLGYVDAMKRIAEIHHTGGFGVTRDRRQAREWRQKAAAAAN